MVALHRPAIRHQRRRFQMRKTVLTTIAGAALIAGSGLAAAQQRIESSPGGANGAQGSSQREPGGAAHERQPGAIQGPAQGRSTANGEQGRRSGESSEMQGQTQKRSGAIEEKERRSGQSGEMQGQTQKRSGAVQGSAQGRSGGSVGSPTLSTDQRTKLRDTIASGDVHRVGLVNFSLSVGTRVPGTARIYDVPESIADIVPEYRGFKYFAVSDELVIIDPGTRAIAAVLPVHGSAQGRSGRSVGSTTLSSDQKSRLHGIISDGNIRRIDEADFPLSVGTRLPDTVEVYDVP